MLFTYLFKTNRVQELSDQYTNTKQQVFQVNKAVIVNEGGIHLLLISDSNVNTVKRKDAN